MAPTESKSGRTVTNVTSSRLPSFQTPSRAIDQAQQGIRKRMAPRSDGQALPAMTTPQLLEDLQQRKQALKEAAATPFDADITAVLRGLRDFSPKPWRVRFRELQAAGGRIEISQARIQQGDMIATATGSLGLTPSGNVEGELQVLATGLDKVIPKLGIDQVLEQGVSQSAVDRIAPGVRAKDVNSVLGALDRAIPGLGRVVRQNMPIKA